jgi:transcriptional regulator with XRE-family HTH domain
MRRHGARYWRLNAGLTIDQVAVMAHVSRPSVMRLERGEGKALGPILFAVAAVFGVAPGMIALDGSPAADYDGPHVSLTECRASLELEPSDVAEQLNIPLAVIRRAEAGAAVQPGYAKRLSDFYGVRVTDWYPVAEDRAAA